MSSLLRYKKSGGFFQLLSLIETFGPQKKEKFLDMIEQESPVWAQALRDKMLTLERIFTWPDQVLVEIFKTMPPKNMAYALQGIKEDQRARITQFFSASEQRRLNDVFTESQPKPEEIASTLVKLVELTRKMIQERQLHPEKFDEALLIPDDFEAKLEQGHVGFKSALSDKLASANSAEVQSAVQQMAQAPAGAPASLEVAQLQRTLGLVLKENKALKDELKALREKLDQIKRMAA